MDVVVMVAVRIALAAHVLLLVICVWRVWRGENVIDRLIGAELSSTLALAMLVLISLLQDNALYILAAVGLAALSFVGTIALARYLVNREMF